MTVTIYTSPNDHWCGDCNSPIPAGVPFIYKYKECTTPNGQKKLKPYRAHVNCKEQKDETKC